MLGFEVSEKGMDMGGAGQIDGPNMNPCNIPLNAYSSFEKFWVPSLGYADIQLIDKIDRKMVDPQRSEVFSLFR